MTDHLVLDDPDHRLCPRCREIRPLDNFSATLRTNGSRAPQSRRALCYLTGRYDRSLLTDEESG